jgi:hypothetical protein
MTKTSWLVAGAAALAFAASGASTAAAQVYSPTFMAPAQSDELGVYLIDVQGGDIGLEGVWRRSLGSFDLGVRGGFYDFDSDGALTVGAELRNPLEVADIPLSLAVTAGAQAIFVDDAAIGLQAGITAGHTFVPGGATVTPYIHPRLALVDGWTDSDDGFDLEVLADIGVDVDFARGLSLRFGANLGDGADWGLGLSWRR